MAEQQPGWWDLAFTYAAVVDAWQDARLAGAIERVWVEAGRPADAEAYWIAAEDEYAFHWYVNDGMAALLDSGRVTWRMFSVGRLLDLPPSARSFLHPRVPMPDGGLGG